MEILSTRLSFMRIKDGAEGEIYYVRLSIMQKNAMNNTLF